MWTKIFMKNKLIKFMLMKERREFDLKKVALEIISIFVFSLILIVTS